MVRAYPRRSLLALAFVAGAALFVLVAWDVQSGGRLAEFDRTVEQRLADTYSDEDRALWGQGVLSAPGHASVAWAAYVLGALACFAFGRLTNAAAIVGGGAVGTGLLQLLKALFDRARPTGEGLAFPSGHAANAVLAYGLALLLVLDAAIRRRRFLEGRRVPGWAPPLAWFLAALLAFVVGSGRVLSGEHWLTDVLGGWALGLSVVAAVLLLHLFVVKRFAPRA